MRWILGLLAGAVVVAALTGWGHPPVPPTGVQDAASARAVRELTLPPTGTTEPSEPTGATGAPGARGGAGPAGRRSACSSPFGSTRYGFDAACRHHDLGYDALRQAAGTGHPLRPWARQAIDRRFAADLSGGCDSTGCLSMAALYAGSVRFNSWRQGDGVPARESWWSVTAAGLAGVAAVLLVALGGHRPRWLRRPAPPVAVAGVAQLGVLQATTLPHPLWLQVLVGGLVGAQAHALGVLGLRVLRSQAVAPLRQRLAAQARPWPGLPDGAGARALGRGAAVVAVAVALSAASAGHDRVAAAVGAAPPGPLFPLAALTGSLLLTAVLVAAAPRAARLPGRLVRGLRALPRSRRRPVLVPAAATLLLAGCAITPVTGTPEATAAGPAGVRSTLLDPVPATGVRPLHVYVPRGAAPSARGRARLAVTALDRAGGLDRSVVLVVVPTGSGWVNPAAPQALERRVGGDVATVAVQYAASPSWIAYLRGGLGADASIRALLGELTAALDAREQERPGRRRPRVVLYGESLGAWAGLRAADGGQLPAGADGALWVGVPSGALPGGTGGHGGPGGPGGTGGVGSGPSTGCGPVVDLTHADDPVASWSPELAVRPTAGWHHLWVPLLSFWQATADATAARAVPDGHGHRYESELAGAWGRVGAASAGCRSA